MDRHKLTFASLVHGSLLRGLQSSFLYCDIVLFWVRTRPRMIYRFAFIDFRLRSGKQTWCPSRCQNCFKSSLEWLLSRTDTEFDSMVYKSLWGVQISDCNFVQKHSGFSGSFNGLFGSIKDVLATKNELMSSITSHQVEQVVSVAQRYREDDDSIPIVQQLFLSSWRKKPMRTWNK